MKAQRIVIKLGGASLGNPATLRQLALLLTEFRRSGSSVIVVHGGGPAINQELQSLGISWQFINGQRQTTQEMMAVIESVLAGKVNASIVEFLNEAQLESVGFSGAKDRILFCEPLSAELQMVGQVLKCNLSTVSKALENQKIAVIAPIGFGAQSQSYNINADSAAAHIAVAFAADQLIFLTDQDGVLDDNKQVMGQLTVARIHQLMDSGTIHGGMLAKAQAMLTAFLNGVKQVRVMGAQKASELSSSSDLGSVLTLEI